MMNKKVVVERHDKRAPHQRQDILIKNELKRILRDRGVKISDKAGIDCVKPLTTPAEIHRAWRVVDKTNCDVPGCTIAGHVKVVRVLSGDFSVNTKKADLKSHIVLAEVPVKECDSEQEAIDKALSMVSVTVRPLTLDVLNRIKRPLEHGYSADEIIDAMMPYVLKHARRYRTPNFPMDDGMQQGRIGVWNAMRTDRAIAPFSSHAFRWIQTNIRRKAMTSGTIRHGERECDIYGTKGVLLGTDEDGNKIFSSLQSADAPIADGVNLYDLIDHLDEEHDPLYQAIEQERIERNLEKLRKIMEGADLSEQQKTVVCLQYALNGKIGNPYDEDTEQHDEWVRGWEHSGTEIAKVMGCSRQRVGQQSIKSLDKLRRAAKDLGIILDDEDE